jgi:hypothetical protein
MNTPLDVAREVFPEADREFLENAIWGRTGYPAFLNLQAYGTPENALRVQLTACKNAASKLGPGQHLCDFCTKVATSRFLCEEHREALQRH